MSQHPRWLEAVAAVRDLRGGVELCEFVAAQAGANSIEFLDAPDNRWYGDGDAFAVVVGEGPQFALIYVANEQRRHGRGTQLWHEVNEDYPDALLLALPGERSIKSLGESAGLTARFIAMGEK